MTDQNAKKTAPQGPRKDFTSSDRLGACSIIAGIIWIITSLFYLPQSLYFNRSILPQGLICGVIGLVFALLSRNADLSPKKSFRKISITGIVLSSIAILLSFLFFYALATYYEALSDPVLGPQINELMNQLQEQLYRSIQETTAVIRP